MDQDALDSLQKDVQKPIVRRPVKSIDAKVKSEYRRSLRTWGFSSQVQVNKGERMSAKLAACFGGVKAKLNLEVPGIQFNPPEIFPVNRYQCIVLITGWKSEIIILRS